MCHQPQILDAVVVRIMVDVMNRSTLRNRATLINPDLPMQSRFAVFVGIVVAAMQIERLTTIDDTARRRRIGGSHHRNLSFLRVVRRR